ncbi:YicC/YloC family endoribonuclease [Roseovarius indicus]|uniref:YicC/YloC family endoribonuclease n=1 Tax=Roseovarius indicus TaxID=540747 RepID=UPI000A903463|nr:YicC/YloC family endoribonuclease [Roseovarius indicus]
MLRSMTAFAAAKGAQDGFSWTWEMRSVNGKGLDLRLRVPDWVDGLEAGLRARAGKALGRGNVSLNLRLVRDDGAGALAVNAAQLEDVLTAMAEVENRAMARGVTLAPATAADLLGLRGVLDTGAGEDDTTALCKTLLADFETVLAAFLDMRATEGRALAAVLTAQLDDIERLTGEAAQAAEARRPEMEQAFKAALARVMETADTADEARIAQEMALIAVKADVTEELDRLRAHVAAARDLLAAGSPVGRKLDFLSQEFNREANTLCSKAQNKALTATGLELKTVIDQMREQVQNVE